MKAIKLFIMALVMVTVIAGGFTAQAQPGTLSASFMADVNTGVAPLTIHFYDASDGSPTGWQWDFGDGSYSTLQNPVYTYNTPGTYTVTLTVTDGAQSDSMSADVVVTNPLVVTPTPRVPVIVEPIPVPIKGPHHTQPIRDQPPAVQPPHNDQPPAHKQPHNDKPKHGK